MSNPLEQAFQGILSGGKYSVKGTGAKPTAAPKAKPKAPAKPSGGFFTPKPVNQGKGQPDPGGDLSHWTPPFPVRKNTKRYGS